jgi:hypothetical protein
MSDVRSAATKAARLTLALGARRRPGRKSALEARFLALWRSFTKRFGATDRVDLLGAGIEYAAHQKAELRKISFLGPIFRDLRERFGPIVVRTLEDGDVICISKTMVERRIGPTIESCADVRR